MLSEQVKIHDQIQNSQERIDNQSKEGQMNNHSELRSQTTEKTQSINAEQNLRKQDGRVLPASVRNLSNQSIQLGTNIKEFRQYGPAVFLFFAFMKKAMILFSVLAVMSLILIFYNCTAGQTYPIKASGVAIAFARASLGSFSAGSDQEERTRMLYQVIISLNIIACFCFWLYWKSYVSSQSSIIEAEIQLANHRTLILEGAGIEQAAEKDVEDFVTQFGPYKETIRVVNRGEQIKLAYQIYKLQRQIAKMSLTGDVPQSTLIQIQKKYDIIEALNDSLKKQMAKNQHNKNLRYFVQMDSHVSQRNVIDKLKNVGFCQKKKQVYLLNGLTVNAKNCEAQPWGVYWQNLHVGIKQRVMPNLILFALTNVVALSTILIFGLISTMAQPVYYQPFLSSNDLSEAQILKSNNPSILASWCIGNDYSSAMESVCSPFIDQLSYRVGIYFAIACVMVLSKYMMKFTILGTINKLRFKDHAERSHTLTMHLFLNYTIVSVVIALSVQTNLFGSAMADVLASFMRIDPIYSRLKALRQYYDYSQEWYADYGFQLVLNYFVIIILPYSIFPLMHFISKKIKVFSTDSRSSANKLKENEELRQFQLQDDYSSCLSAIVVGMIFAGGMPIMFPLILAALVVRYFSIKFLFIYVNKPPMLTDRLIAKKISLLLFIAFFGYMINTTWALGVEQIFTPKIDLFEGLGINSSSNAHTVPEAFLVFLRRVINNWHILFVFSLCLILTVFRKRLSNTWFKLLRMLKIRGSSHSSGEMNHMDHIEEDHPHHQRSYDPLTHQIYREVFEKLKIR